MSMRMPPFTLEQLRTFEAVAQLGSMTLAGRSLGLTQGAITQQVRAMERELALCLVRRTGRNVRLTPEGEAVAAAGRIAIRAVEGVMDVARSAASGETGHIRVGASPVTADYYVHRPLAALIEAHPHVSFDVTVAEDRVDAPFEEAVHHQGRSGCRHRQPSCAAGRESRAFGVFTLNGYHRPPGPTG